MTKVLGTLLRIDNPDLEQEWQDEFHKGLRIADLQWNIFTSLATLIILLRFRSLGWAIQVRTVLAGTVDSGMLVLQLYNYPLFSRHREKLITVARLIRIVANFLMLVGGRGELYLPIALAAVKPLMWSTPSVWRLMAKASTPIMQTFGYRIQLCHHVWLLAITTLLLLSTVPRICALECTTEPDHFGQHYGDMLRPLLRLKAFIPFPMAPVWHVAEYSCVQSCRIVTAFVEVFVGNALPTLLLAAFEEQSRLEFLVWRGGTPFIPSLLFMLLYTLCLLPLVAVIALTLFDTLETLFAFFE